MRRGDQLRHLRLGARAWRVDHRRRQSVASSSGSSGRRKRSRASTLTCLSPWRLAPAGIHRLDHGRVALDRMHAALPRQAAARRCRSRQRDRRCAPRLPVPPRTSASSAASPSAVACKNAPGGGTTSTAPKRCSGARRIAITSPSHASRARSCVSASCASIDPQRSVQRLAARHVHVEPAARQAYRHVERALAAAASAAPAPRPPESRASGRDAAGGNPGSRR